MNTYEVLWKKSSEPFVINTMVICARTENDARNMFHSVNPYTLVSIVRDDPKPVRKSIGAAVREFWAAFAQIMGISV